MAHPFVVSDTLSFTDDGGGIIRQRGTVECQKSVMLDVAKWFDTRYSGNTLRVRCSIYVYIGWLQGQHLLLKYHNVHRDQAEYHHRVYDPATGNEVFHEVLERYQFPTFTEVLDELQFLVQDL